MVMMILTLAACYALFKGVGRDEIVCVACAIACAIPLD
jgi:hypothetical protein